jgi:polyphosphate kinase
MSNSPQTQSEDNPPERWSEALYDRDLGWLKFNERVLHEAVDERTPLLERLKFLAIFTSNLDEFFMKRIDTLRLRSHDPLSHDPISRISRGVDPLWLEIRRRVIDLLDRQHKCFSEQLRPALAKHGVHLLKWDDLTADQIVETSQYFQQNVLPVVTPLAYDPVHPFPFLSNLSTSLGIVLRTPGSDQQMFARVKVPATLPPWIELRSDGSPDRHFVSLLETVQNHLEQLFPGMEVISKTLFRITRDAEVEPEKEKRDDFRDTVEAELRQRRFEPVVRIDFGSQSDPWVIRLLTEKLELCEADVYELSGLLDYTGLFGIASLPIPALRDQPWTPLVPPALLERDGDMLALIRAGDVLVHHPYESFDATVEKFIQQSADDPAVLAIKMTVYRVGDDTPFVRSLIRAAESGKQVACVIEITARFDEARNLHWSQQLEAAGAHVVYGVMGLKTHSKIAIVVRQESHGLRSYAHIGTGNYHVKTARLYTDLGLFTCDPILTNDVTHLFHFLTGHSLKKDFQKLLVAPTNMRNRFLQLIRNEIEHAQAGRPALIVAKMNQLEDPEMCQALCTASQAGVQIELIVRGFSCLLPGLKGLTENIRIISVIGRFLEHSRVFYFASGQTDPLEGEFFIGSADWMYRNLSGRVEAATPVESRHLRQRIWELLTLLRADQRQAWDLQSDGEYLQRMPVPGLLGPDQEGTQEGTQVRLMNLTRLRAANH